MRTVVTTFFRPILFAAFIAVISASATNSVSAQERKGASTEAHLWQQVEVVRTANGVPHIRAQNLRAAGYALAWLQSEDYGTVTAMEVLEASGRAASVLGYEKLESDMAARRYRDAIVKNYHRLSKDTRDVYEGFAAGVNRYIQLHPEKFPKYMPADLNGYDVAATESAAPSIRKIRAFISRVDPAAAGPERDVQASDEEGEETPDDGSNAWALAPGRTRSGNAILLRNPHLSWSAGYYEAHMTVPGVIDFYGDFRIGGPFAVIGGFNRYLGFSTTNNSPDLDQFYALDADPAKQDHYLFDGTSIPLQRQLVTVSFRNGDGLSTETREYWSTPIGPVIHRANGKVYILKYAGDGEYRAGEQFLRMMRARSLAEWKEAMKMRARVTSNFTYADRAGNIFYIWNASLPLLPHPPSGDLEAVPARRTEDVWTRFVPFESLPQVLNPPGGYIHQENSSHHFTNVRGPVQLKNAYPNFEEPRLSLRSQLAIQLIGGDDKFSLEEIVALKHNYRALLADRVKNDLIKAVRAANPAGDVEAAISLIERWDNTTAPESRGAALFEIWWTHYSGIRPPERRLLPDNKRYARIWSAEDPLNTPTGLADSARAVESFKWAVEEIISRYGRFDVMWGDIHRVRRGKVDVPVGGCGNDLGCFRIMTYTRDNDGRLKATGGDGWVLAVEFSETPRAYSVLAYGQSSIPESPWHSDQAEMFARGEMKRVAFTSKDIDRQALIRFRPGQNPVKSE